MTALRVALVGAGRWGQVVGRALLATPRLELACVVDPERSVREALEARGVRAHAHVDAALAGAPLDAVFVAAPSRLHASLAERALLAGKHVLVEKPLALCVADATRVRDAAASTGRVAMVGHLLRFHPGFEALEARVARGELGRIERLRSVRVGPATLRADENAWWSLAPHDVSLQLALAGCLPSRVSARGGAVRGDGRFDRVEATLEFPGGLDATVEVSWLEPRWTRRLEVQGTLGEALLDEVSAPARPLDLQLARFVAACLDGHRPPCSVAEGLDVVRVLDAGQRSLDLGGATVPLVAE